MKSGYIIIKVEHEADSLEKICKECDWDLDHENLLDAQITGYVEHNPEFDYEVLHWEGESYEEEEKLLVLFVWFW